MVRYYYINVDLKSGYDSPERCYNNLHAAKKDFDCIILSDSIIYKSLSAFDDEKGSYNIESESYDLKNTI